jgi:hypothetical protein
LFALALVLTPLALGCGSAEEPVTGAGAPGGLSGDSISGDSISGDATTSNAGVPCGTTTCPVGDLCCGVCDGIGICAKFFHQCPSVPCL